MKEKVSLEEVRHVAELANLPLDEAELKKLSAQLSEVIDFNISHLNKVKTENVVPTAHVLGVTNRLREDNPEPGLSQEDALKNGKEVQNGFFKVKAILEAKSDE